MAAAAEQQQQSNMAAAAGRQWNGNGTEGGSSRGCRRACGAWAAAERRPDGEACTLPAAPPASQAQLGAFWGRGWQARADWGAVHDAAMQRAGADAASEGAAGQGFGVGVGKSELGSLGGSFCNKVEGACRPAVRRLLKPLIILLEPKGSEGCRPRAEQRFKGGGEGVPSSEPGTPCRHIRSLGGHHHQSNARASIHSACTCGQLRSHTRAPQWRLAQQLVGAVGRGGLW